MARRPLHALLVAAVSAALTVGLVLVPSTAGAAVRPAGPLSLASGAYFGALVNPDRSTPSSTPAEVDALEAKIGRDARHRQPLLHLRPGRRDEGRGPGPRRRPDPDDHLGRHVHAARSTTAPRTPTSASRPPGSAISAARSSCATSTSPRATTGPRWCRPRPPTSPPGSARSSCSPKSAPPTSSGCSCTTAYSFRVVPTRARSPSTPATPSSTGSARTATTSPPASPARSGTASRRSSPAGTPGPRQRPKPLMAAEYGVMEDPSQPNRKAGWYNDMRTAVKTTLPAAAGRDRLEHGQHQGRATSTTGTSTVRRRRSMRGTPWPTIRIFNPRGS